MSDEFQIDFDRDKRLGFGEAIFCAGKSVTQIRAILEDAKQRQKSLLLTRCAPEMAAALGPPLDYDEVSQTAFFGSAVEVSDIPRIAIVAAGTSDVPVAREAERTLRFNGHRARMILDVGVAGLWRLQARLPEIRKAAIVMAVAGMDAALPTVLGGLVPQPIIGVPTSIGYGATRGGETALMAMLSSCAPGLTVVNIDNGYGAACAALRMIARVAADAPLDQ
ncbi:MAG: nickel pincer cofactor biosynthesis protein LarB [Pseudomonadota bacterium]